MAIQVSETCALPMLHFQANLFLPYVSLNELRHARLTGTL